MSLVVENGTGLAGAESYVSVADANAYHFARGQEAWSDGSTAEKESALRRATTFIDGRYGGRFSGTRANGRVQALLWPRSGATDVEGWAIEGLPLELVRATAEAALRELASPGSLSPDIAVTSAGGAVIRTKVVAGPVEEEIEYEKGTVTTGTTRPLVQILDDVLAPLLSGLGSGFGSLPLVRA